MSGKKRYPIRIPRFAAGIRAQESRTGSGRSWWAREWTRRLETMGLRGRLGRGKSYALSGQVVSLAMRARASRTSGGRMTGSCRHIGVHREGFRQHCQMVIWRKGGG